MKLTHQCPNCKELHQMDSTPEPDKLCPVCELVEKRIVEAYIPVKMWINNNVFVKENCVICKYSFKASMILYELSVGYICPECAYNLSIRTKVSDEIIMKAQEKTFNFTYPKEK